MRLLFSDDAWEDYLFWQFQGDRKTLDRINALVKEAGRTPFTGIGKPESLKGDLSGWWSRRITDEHRMVYRVTAKGDAQQLELSQLRYHY